eukprot:CAMPEP_0198288576 /NCGR_PEP_ID=MMETSP1449-20131203/7027_1 /TAXON_ID=420275 /ORGANISM="Attheya septentrionalis, Strain CCMP2084" /LENGTH=402 /DNA_ID=CAMNT_0043986739 /DNA_START=186 /DNA_END=1390 /DNA_ORIENTATION=+
MSVTRVSSSPSPSSTTTRSVSSYMWGTSKEGTIPQLTDGVHDHPKPIDLGKALGVELNDELSIQQLECGPTGTAVVLSDGSCYTVGSNKNGQLGQGHKEAVLQPTKLKLEQGVSHICLGSQFSALIDAQGDLYTAGYNGSMVSGLGCLGHGVLAGDYEMDFRLVDSLVEDGCTAQKVTVGDTHMTVLTTEGEVLTTGAGGYGRLGNLETVDQLFLEPVELICGENVVDITGGLAFTLALTKDGILHGWGRNDKGQLGMGMGLAVDMYAMEALPRPLEAQLEGRVVTKVSAGHSHAACVTSNGELFVWGSGNHLEPELMTSLLHTRCVDVACGQGYTLALDEDGKLYSVGRGGSTGVLGQASVKKLPHPALMDALVDQKTTQISAGWNHAACLVEDTTTTTTT